MSVRIATFNIENLMRRFDYSGFRNELNIDRSLLLYDIRDEKHYRDMESARMVATATIHSRAIGIRRFQPSCMNWS